MTVAKIEAHEDLKESGRLTLGKVRVIRWLRSKIDGGTIREYCTEKQVTPNQISGRFSDLTREGWIYIVGRRDRHSVYYYEDCPFRRDENRRSLEYSKIEGVFEKLNGLIKNGLISKIGALNKIYKL